MSEPRPVVSMCCVTYNQADTIAQCLDGMLMQRVDVPVEIVVHDDASTDGTADIVLRYMAEHPGRIRAILREENQFSQGKRPAALVFSEAQGDYFALCEGDDFWTDPEKITTQLAVLEAEPDIDMCAHAVTIWQYSDGEKMEERVRTYPTGHYPSKDVIRRRGISAPTPTIFIRREAAENFILFVSSRKWLKFGDVYLKFFGSQRGGIHFIDRNMAIYRRQFTNSWTIKYSQQPDFLFEQQYAKMNGIMDLKSSFKGEHCEDLIHVSKVSLEKILHTSGINILKKAKATAFYVRHTGNIRMVKTFLKVAFRK